MTFIQQFGKEKIEKRSTSKSPTINLFILCFLGLGTVALLISIIVVSAPLALIGTSLLFWGVILFYIRPEHHVKKSVLDSILIPQFSTVNQLIQELGYKGKQIYLSPDYLKNPDKIMVYIPKHNSIFIPTEKLRSIENKLFLNDPQGILLTPPGAGLEKLFEKTLHTKFSGVNLEYLLENLPRILVDDLKLAEKVEIVTRDNQEITLKISNSIFPNSNNSQYVSSSCKIADLLCSAIACALTKSIGKPIAIEEIQQWSNGNVILVTYQTLEESEPQTAKKRFLELRSRKPNFPKILSRFSVLIMTSLGSIILAWLTWVTWFDITYWGKDILEIFFGSRTGAISLGINMKFIYYFVIGLFLFISGLFTYLAMKRNKS